MALSVHQVHTARLPTALPDLSHPNYSSSTISFATPTAGHGLTLALGLGHQSPPHDVTTPAGWTQRGHVYTGVRELFLFTRLADGTEGTSLTVTHESVRRTELYFIEHDGVFASIVTDTDSVAGTTHPIPSLTPTAGLETLLIGFIQHGNIQSISAHPSSYTHQGFINVDDGASEGMSAWTRYVASASGSYSGTTTYGANCVSCSMQLAFTANFPPVADFSGDQTSIASGDSIVFTDLSTNTPTSWLWDFGDGSTSTSQNPTHQYANPGTYTITLTATNAFGSDSETKTAYIVVSAGVPFEEPPPANALIEIYASEPGSAKWDEANWDEAVWSTAGWQDVTPQSVHAVVQWGSSQPELGILSRPSAGSWSVDTYDPNRLLDPANEDSPYFGDLEPGLPIRISHRGIVVKQGVVESMSFGFADDQGFIRVQDAIAIMANAKVPDDIDLGDTLYARARAAIAAAGLSVQVLSDPPGGDPALVPWVTGTDRSVWQWITDAAESVLYIPYITNNGRLGFRAWASPLARARDLTATELVDLVSLIQYDGQYSVVNALDTDGVTVVERASSPPPRYGARTYSRNSATPNVDDWLEAVLADRVRAGLRWIPGRVYPLTADSVEKYATIEPVELLSLSNLYANPVVAEDIIIVGGRIELTAKKDDEAIWAFEFEAAETVTTPLITEDGAGFVLSEGGDQFLYPE